jgi:uncharacterized membrane protein
MTNRIIFVFSLLGLAISSYLAYEYSLPGTIGCPIAGQGCDIVRSSEYSHILGISVPYFGILYYIMMVGLSIIQTTRSSPTIKKFQLILAALGFLFSLYLTALEAFVIHAYCFWCLLSAIISTLIFGLLATPLIRKSHEH